MKRRLFTLLGDSCAVPFFILAVVAGCFWIMAQRAYEEAEPERFQSW